MSEEKKGLIQGALRRVSLEEKGGSGSGHPGHRGRQGTRGGSLPKAAGTHPGGRGVPDFSDMEKRAFISERTRVVDGQTIYAIVSLRRMVVYRDKPYRMETSMGRQGGKFTSTAQERVASELAAELLDEVTTRLTLEGWKKNERGYWAAPWGPQTMKRIRLTTRQVPEAMPEDEPYPYEGASYDEWLLEQEVDALSEPPELPPSAEPPSEEPPEEGGPGEGVVTEEEVETEEIEEEQPLALRILGALRRIITRGGEGSGHRGHRGRVGEVGGSEPGKGPPRVKAPSKIQVGITSARPGKAPRTVFKEMNEFKKRMSEIKGVKNLSVQPGLGGWEGGSEPTWVVTYSGDGDALRLIADTARQYNQEAVLLMRECEPPQDCSPVVDFNFADPVTPDERKEVDNLLVKMGIGGWTWFRDGEGRRVLRSVAVPQWGGQRQAHLSAARRLREMFDAIDMPHEYAENETWVDVMEREGDYAYEAVLTP